MSRRFIAFAAAILIAAPVASGESSGQDAPTSTETRAQIKKVPVPYTRVSSGKDMYLSYCASCHGTDAKGNGPAASAMRSAPTDLTQLAASNGGRFPENHVSQMIKGDYETPSHGSKDMPVWGSIFEALGTKNDGEVQLRIRNLTKYIASLQQHGRTQH
jgi:mono/diheme cytochrome c family protein